MPPVTRVGQDSHIGHASPTPSPFHSTPYASGSPNVLTNGSPTVRIGDTTGCGDPAVGGSGTVFVNGIGVSRQGDNNTSHLLPPNVPPCPAHSAPIASGSSTVFVNGKGIGRVGDSIAGCTSVAAGSSNVFAGG